MQDTHAARLAADVRRLERAALRRALIEAEQHEPSSLDRASNDPTTRARVGRHDHRIAVLRHLRHVIQVQEDQTS